MSGPANLADAVIGWQRQHGRHDLPWQGTPDPYRVWLSEIMLQQTQVATVLAYYPRFLDVFPDVQRLAAASVDQVLAQWSGLGYYRRARLLHRCAQEVVSHWGGDFPTTAHDLECLPGIGRSTAAAIAAFCFGERVSILDGNVRRLLVRVHGLAIDLRPAAAQRELWRIATASLPAQGGRVTMAPYTQGLMDLGATVCLPRRPRCNACPVHGRCVAAARGEPERYPPRAARPARAQQSLWLAHRVDAEGRVWLQRRPACGIWGGLHCLPVFDTRADLIEAIGPTAADRIQEHAPVRHLLTHRELHLHIVTVQAAPDGQDAVDAFDTSGQWVDRAGLASLGLPVPVSRFLAGHAAG